jgi:diadenosine tetraphosphate (Ap4A) HIT family hydrolase
MGDYWKLNDKALNSRVNLSVLVSIRLSRIPTGSPSFPGHLLVLTRSNAVNFFSLSDDVLWRFAGSPKTTFTLSDP